MTITENIIIAIITGAVALTGGIVTLLYQHIQSNKLVMMRLDELDSKIDKHNQLIERVIYLEQSDKLIWAQIREYAKKTVKGKGK
jgi:hypothetical protein